MTGAAAAKSGAGATGFAWNPGICGIDSTGSAEGDAAGPDAPPSLPISSTRSGSASLVWNAIRLEAQCGTAFFSTSSAAAGSIHLTMNGSSGVPTATSSAGIVHSIVAIWASATAGWTKRAAGSAAGTGTLPRTTVGSYSGTKLRAAICGALTGSGAAI